ncbi:MAG: hypothetical protein EOP52_13530 [Sphingobacteriales bacterium]|nr:MAG: hypothetical protein EOP52_13530 [Sphingobacteriales bacterium]
MKVYIIVLVGFVSFLYSCSGSNADDISSQEQTTTHAPTTSPYTSKYAGSYVIDVKGAPSSQEVEGYALRRDGTAKWMLIVNDGNGGASIQSEKNGTWVAEQDKIVVSIEGNTGLIQETWQLQNGLFYDANNSNRHLKTKD